MIETAFKSIEPNELLENCTDLQRAFPRVSGSRGIPEFQQQQYESRSSELSSSGCSSLPPLLPNVGSESWHFRSQNCARLDSGYKGVSSLCLSVSGLFPRPEMESGNPAWAAAGVDPKAEFLQRLRPSVRRRATLKIHKLLPR